MTKIRSLPVAYAASFFLVLCGTVAFAVEPTTLTIHVDRPGVKISPMLYGIFFEEINRAGDGGLYGEMLQNRSFEDDRGDRDQKPKKIPGWHLVAPPSAKAAISLDSSQPLNPRNPTSLRLEKTGAAQLPAAVASDGFQGLALFKGTSYDLSFYARCSNETGGQLRATLEDQNGQVVSEAKLIDQIGQQWKQYHCTLTAKKTTATGRLVLAYPSPGAIWLDQVSLFPQKTWKGRPNGLRPDLAEMLADLKPAFNRFPGGCYVEGNRLANAFRWKDSIGDLAERPGHWNLWGYRSTDGLGYHEYLQMCEDLGAEPLFVINCGMAHEDNIPKDKLGPWIQDALDAIEYAKGPADSRWGSLRAKAGHPAPFKLRYMEIGNENGGPIYEDHYRQFYDAIKAKHPEMILVANGPVLARPMDILDEHYYDSPEFFMRNAKRYDAYDRKKSPKIYVGEYAVTQGCGKGNLLAALGEAAFMTGMERNSDVVLMASYAPLFVNCGWRQWNPNAINFDNSRVYGTPSYYVQKMFCVNRGDVVLGMDFDGAVARGPLPGGAIGVGTWATQAEFKDIKVTQGDKVLFQSDFSAGLGGWRTNRGRWQVNGGALQQTAEETNARAIVGDKSWKDYTLTLKARKLGGAEGFLILFNVQDESAKSWWNIGGWGNVRHAIEMDGVNSPAVEGRIETGRWYDIKIEKLGNQIRCYLDGKLIHDARRGCVDAMYAVASRVEKTGDVILKIVNADFAPHDVRISLAGLNGTVKSGTITRLTSPDPLDENSLENRDKVVPKESLLLDAGADFVHTFPGNSVSVIRLTVSPMQ
jgi:alpha-L-arabinofuranosidase